MVEKFAREKDVVLSRARNGISSNMRLNAAQKKYLKNLLLYALMNASKNESVTEHNFIKLVNKLFKRFLAQIIIQYGDCDDDDVDEGLEVELNTIMADAQKLDLEEVAAVLTPSNIVALIKANSNGLSQRQILNRLLALRDIKANHRETPEEAREREKRRKEYEMQKIRDRMLDSLALTHGDRSRS